VTATSPSLFSGRPLLRSERIGLSIIIGVACAIGVWIIAQRVMPSLIVKDFTYPWWAARALLGGGDPYRLIQPDGPYPFAYPLPAALVAMPVAWLPAPIAGAVFFGLSAAALSWALLADGGIWRLWMLASVPFAMSLALVQWAPLLIAGALLPALAWVLVCKPTLGLALFAGRPSRAAVIGGAIVLAVSLLFLPTWPAEWLRAAGRIEGHPAFVTRPFGWIPLLALLRWRDGDARLVALMACMPQNPFFYDQLPVLLVARTGRSAFALSALSWIAYAATQATCNDPFYCGPEAEPWVVWLVFVPATALVLLRGRTAPLFGRWWPGRRAPASDA
jgi:hypothetical protein